MSHRNYGGQRANMEDASMVATLANQATVVWPKEREILRRRSGESWARVLDVGCGTGELLKRIRGQAGLAVGVDLFPGHLCHAEPPVLVADGLSTPFADGTFDLVCVRHLLQALPDPVALLREAHRVLKPGGRLHLLVEDYQAILFDADDAAVEGLFTEVTPLFLPRGTDLYQGRRALRHAREAGFRDVTVDPLLIDNQGDDREAFARVFRHWGEGYAATLAGLLARPVEEIRRRFAVMESLARDPERFTAWLLFVVSAAKLSA